MAHGIEVYNADGSLQFDSSNRLFRRLQVVNTGTTDGSVVVSDVSQGTFAFAALTEPNTGTTPRFSASGGTVSWTFGSAPVAQRSAVQVGILVY